MNNIRFHSDQHLSQEELIDYSRGYLSNSEMHRIEVHLVSCELCNEALQGIKLLANPDQLNESAKKISAAIGVEEKKGLTPYQYIGMAASVVLLAVVGYFMLRTSHNQENLVNNQVEEPYKENPIETQATEGEDSSLLALNEPVETQDSQLVAVTSSEPAVNEMQPQQQPTPATIIEQDTTSIAEAFDEEQDELLADLVMDDTADTLPDTLALGYGIAVADSPQTAAIRSKAVPEEAEPMRAAEKKALTTEVPYLAATPEKGMRSYERYLKRKMRYPNAARENNIEGDVVLTITINADGTVGDIAVTRSLGYGCDEEAIRLIKGGGNWVPGTRSGIAITDTVTVTVSFRK